MSITKTVLAAVGLAAVGYGIYRGAKLVSEIALITDGQTAEMMQALMTSSSSECVEAEQADGSLASDSDVSPGAQLSPS